MKAYSSVILILLCYVRSNTNFMGYSGDSTLDSPESAHDIIVIIFWALWYDFIFDFLFMTAFLIF